jgi:alpha-tubulin suppressor-like RCC1 family protein
VNSDIPVPVSLPGGTTVKEIAAGDSHSLALTSTGQVLAWGFNAVGELGDGTTTDRHTPVPVALPTGVTVTGIAAGRFHSLAITSTGRAWPGASTTKESSAMAPISPAPSLCPSHCQGAPR